MFSLGRSFGNFTRYLYFVSSGCFTSFSILFLLTEEGSSKIDSFTSHLDSWKGLFCELELLSDEKNVSLVLNLVLVGKII